MRIGDPENFMVIVFTALELLEFKILPIFVFWVQNLQFLINLEQTVLWSWNLECRDYVVWEIQKYHQKLPQLKSSKAIDYFYFAAFVKFGDQKKCSQKAFSKKKIIIIIHSDFDMLN